VCTALFFDNQIVFSNKKQFRLINSATRQQNKLQIPAMKGDEKLVDNLCDVCSQTA